MRVTLGSRDIRQLKAALETILTPSAHLSPEQWGLAVMRDVRTLLRADQVFFALPLDGSVHVTGDGDRTAEAGRQYEADYWQTDLVIGQRRRMLGLEVHHQDQLYKPGEIEHDVLYNEWCVPNKLFDTLGMAVDVSQGPIPAGVNVYHDSAASPAFGERGAALMHLLLPAFRASVRSYSVLSEMRESMSRLIDTIPTGMCLVDSTGEMLHLNTALELLYLAESDAERLRAAVRRVAQALVVPAAGSQRRKEGALNPSAFERLQTTTNCYEIRCTGPGEVTSLPGAAAIVMVEVISSDHTRRRRTAEQVRNRFRLTRRETEVALLLAQRFTASEIAASLGISAHTVRHHTESVFSKTGVTSRGMIANLFDC